MVNLLADQPLVPELLQENCTPERLSDTVVRLLAGGEVAAAQRRGFKDVLASLRPAEGLPSEAAAEALLELLRNA
jgi:lipid-A-disaccharide synthase